MSALRRIGSAVLTPTGGAVALAVLAGLWAVAGLPGGRVAAAVAVFLAGGYVLYKVAFLTEAVRRLEREQRRLARPAAGDAVTAAVRRLDGAEQRIKKAERGIERLDRRIEANRRRTDRATTLARETGAVLRAEIAGSRLEERDWHPIDPSGVIQPLLSIAIPGYNRPEQLWRTLDALVDQIEPAFADRVEVIVTDDRSTDRMATEVAHQFARDHSFIGFRRNEHNIGLERNLIRCSEPCRGTYLWVFGNDDLIGPEALDVILRDLERDEYDLVVLDKERMDKHGAAVDFRPGTRPIELPPGDSHVFESMLAVGRQTGLISTFGWITQVIRRRAPYMAVDPEPFFETTLHPHLGMMLVAFPRSPVLFRAIVGVIHRTQDRRERLAEAAGRPEVAYMAGGKERDARWFGAGYAALLQRAIDRCEIRPEELLHQREALWTELSLLDWIAENWRHGVAEGLQLDDDIVADALRLYRSLDLEPLRDTEAV